MAIEIAIHRNLSTPDIAAPQPALASRAQSAASTGVVRAHTPLTLLGNRFMLASEAHPAALPRSAQEDVSKALELLSKGGLFGEELVDTLQQLEALLPQMVQLKAQLQSGSAAGQQAGLQQMAGEVEQRMQDRIAYLRSNLQASPQSAAALYRAKAQYVRAALQVLKDWPSSAAVDQVRKALATRERELEQAGQNAPATGRASEILGRKKLGLLGRLRHPLLAYQQRNALHAHSGELLAGRDVATATPQIDELSIIETTLAALARVSERSEAGVRHALHHAHNEVLNNGQQWKPINTRIQLQGGAVQAQSCITPAANYFPSYQGHGVNAHSSAEYRHAVNLASTTLTQDGRTLFTGLRHGVVSAFGLGAHGLAAMPDAELEQCIAQLMPELAQHGSAACQIVRADPAQANLLRQRANLNRANEIASAALMADPALYQAALVQGADDAPLKLNLVSISLLTPDHVRSAPASNERQMWADQQLAWRQAADQTKQLTVYDAQGQARTCRVEVAVQAMNYGVNQGALVGFGPLSSGVNMISGWDDVTPGNNQALAALIGPGRAGQAGGLVGQYMARLESQLAQAPDQQQPALALRLSQMSTLVEQVRSIAHSASYRTDGGEPYKLPARLAVLCQMAGLQVAFNCKSGKDRTGELDAEIKYLSLQMANGSVPALGAPRSAAQQRDFNDVVNNSGNFEMQRLNTGFAGYKLLGVPGVYRRMGGASRREPVVANFLGQSGYTAS